MKKLILILAILIIGSTKTNAQPLTFEEVVQVPELTSNEIYELARMWFVESFTNANNVLQINDKELGQLVGKGLFFYKSATFGGSAPVNGDISFIIKILCKDGRYKYIITDFTHAGTNTPNTKAYSFGIITEDKNTPVEIPGMFKNWNQKQWTKMQNECKTTAKTLIKTLKSNISKENLQDNW